MTKVFTESIIQEIHLKIEEAYDLSNEALEALIDEMVRIKGQASQLTIDQQIQIAKDIYADLRGLSVIQPLMEDPEVTEIMVNGYQQVYIEKQGELSKTDISFASKDKLEDMIQKIVGRVNRSVNESAPICDARLPDGSRVNVVLEPVAINGPILTIRKFSNQMIDMNALLSNGSLSKEMAQLLKALVEKRYNIFICGGTGSGKTTLLNILSNYVKKDERIITIEDSAELKLENVAHLVRLEARNSNSEGNKEIAIRDLIRTGLRMRPDRMIVGEVRGHEAIDMLQAMNTGHDGSLSTGHANSIKDMISRLETMVLLHEEIPMKAIRNQIASAIDIFIHVGRTPNYERKVLEIAEVMEQKDDEIILRPLFKYITKENTTEFIKCFDLKNLKA